MVGLFAGIGRLVGFTVGGWLAGWFVCYPVCRSVEPSGRLAISNLSPTCHVAVHIYSHVAYTVPSASHAPTCKGLESIFGDTTIDSANTPWIGILENAFFLDLNHECLYVIVVFEVFPRLSQVWGEICSHPHVICIHCPVLISGRENF